MAFDNPLDEVWNSYELSLACFAVARRTIAKPPKYDTLWKDTGYDHLLPIDLETIDQSRRELDNLVIISLWAKFERDIVEYVQNAANTIGNVPPVSIAKPLSLRVAIEIERWRINDVLDLFKQIVDSKLLDQTRNIKGFRDWIAHKNPANKGHVHIVGPGYGYKVLSTVLEQIYDAIG